MTTRTGYWIKVIDCLTEFPEGTVQSVKEVHTNPDGSMYYSIVGSELMWRAEHFEEVIVHKKYDDAMIVYEAPEQEVSFPLSVYLELVESATMFDACVNMKIHEWAYFEDMLVEYKRLKKENLK